MNNHVPEIIILKNPAAVAEYTAKVFIDLSRHAEKNNSIKHIALSGGSTPALLFEILASDIYKDQINWQNIHLWWGDERTVPPDNTESNYGKTHALLLSKITIPEENIHRIKGEFEAEKAAAEYQRELIDHIPVLKGIPVFDWTILGMGDDAHTASLFRVDPDFYTDDLTAVTTHPETDQRRITLTPKTLCASKRITFMVTGRNKAEKIKEILGERSPDKGYPASHIRSENGITEWVLEKEAAKLL